MQAGRVLWEVAIEKMVRAILQMTGSPMETVQNYAVLRLPCFPGDAVRADDENPALLCSPPDGQTRKFPWALQLRQAQRRCLLAAHGEVCYDGIRRVEHRLRPFGLTSTFPFVKAQPKGGDPLGIAYAFTQFAVGGVLVDVGPYYAQPRFSRDTLPFLFSYAATEVRRIALPVISARETPQPDSCFAVNFSFWEAWGDDDLTDEYDALAAQPQLAAAATSFACPHVHALRLLTASSACLGLQHGMPSSRQHKMQPFFCSCGA